MPIIKTVTPEQAEGKVKDLYAMFDQLGTVPLPFQMHSSSEELLEHRANLIGYWMTHPTLNPGLMALVRMIISEKLDYYYCLSLNTEILKMVGVMDEDAAAKVLADPASAPLGDKDKAMLLFVLKAVLTPQEVTAQDTQALRDLGWSDRDILDATAHGAGMVADGIMFNAFKMEDGQAC